MTLSRRQMMLDMDRHTGFVMTWVDGAGVILEQVGSGLWWIEPPDGADSWIGQSLLPEIIDILHECMESGERLDYTIDWPTPAGQLTPWSVSVMPRHDGAGRACGGLFAANIRVDSRRPHPTRLPDARR